MKNLPIIPTLLLVASGMLNSAGALSASEADTRIENAFNESYVAKTYLKNDPIEISVTGTTATLTGTVSGESHRSLAKETAASLPGVKSVDDQLVIKASESTGMDDDWIHRKVQLALLFHRHVDVNDTTVAVKNGVVTLTGTTSSEAQRDLTTAYAKDIDGVKEVKNLMTVKATTSKHAELSPGQKLDDASIIAQVKTAMKLHRSTRSSKAQFAVRNGTVSITGIAANKAEVTMVGNLVADIKGVTEVNNKMTVAEISVK